jgi:large subunit ribosomal protein L15
MAAVGLVKKETDPIVILGDGDLSVALTVKAHRFSASAKERIEAAGGTVEVLPLS